MGNTKRVVVNNIEMQGSTWGPLKCSVQIDQIGKDSLSNNENLFMYKNEVAVPPLAFIDDILSVTECGQESIKANVFINSKIECKKLEFSSQKYHQIHVGEKKEHCPELEVHTEPIKKVTEAITLKWEPPRIQ